MGVMSADGWGGGGDGLRCDEFGFGGPRPNALGLNDKSEIR
jgi:hypothetical protein